MPASSETDPPMVALARKAITDLENILFTRMRRWRIPLSLTTDVSFEFGKAGGDAEEFMTAFSEALAVDLTDFELLDRFVSEAELLCEIGRRIRGQRRKPLTVGMLACAARRGRWRSSSVGAVPEHDSTIATLARSRITRREGLRSLTVTRHRGGDRPDRDRGRGEHRPNPRRGGRARPRERRRRSSPQKR